MSTPPRISIYDQIYAIYQKITGSETASSEKQDELRGVQGTGASYNPPTGGSGVFGWLSGIYKTNTDISAKLPAALGAKTAANSLAVTLSTDGTFAQAFGTTADAAAAADDSTASHISLFKRLLAKITAGIPLLNGGSAVSSSNPLPTASSACVIASNGVNVPVDSLQQTLAYTDGAVASISVTYLSVVYVQTYTYTAGNITSISQWVAQ